MGRETDFTADPVEFGRFSPVKLNAVAVYAARHKSAGTPAPPRTLVNGTKQTDVLTER